MLSIYPQSVRMELSILMGFNLASVRTMRGTTPLDIAYVMSEGLSSTY